MNISKAIKNKFKNPNQEESDFITYVEKCEAIGDEFSDLAKSVHSTEPTLENKKMYLKALKEIFYRYTTLNESASFKRKQFKDYQGYRRYLAEDVLDLIHRLEKAIK